jgi:hypothetical protein
MLSQSSDVGPMFQLDILGRGTGNPREIHHRKLPRKPTHFQHQDKHPKHLHHELGNAEETLILARIYIVTRKCHK